MDKRLGATTLYCVLAAGLIGACPRITRADEPRGTANPAAIAAARAHFKLGQAHLDAGNYDEAVSEFRQAYTLARAENTFFLLGEAYRLKGDKKSAVENYQNYVRAKPNGSKADEARKQIALLTRALKEEQASAEQGAAASAVAAKPASPGPAGGEQTGARNAAASAAEPPASSPIRQGAAEPPPAATHAAPAVTAGAAPTRARPLRRAGIALLVSGALAAIGGGAGFELAAASQNNQIVDLSKQRLPFQPVLQSRADVYSALGWAALGVGAAAAVTGAALMVVDSRQSGEGHRSTVTLAASFGPGCAAIIAGGRF